MRISTWPRIWRNYIFKVEQANIFKVDFIYKLLDLFFSLRIGVCSVCYPAQSSTAPSLDILLLLLLPSHSQEENELLLQRHSILRESNFCRKGILVWGLPNSIQGSLHVTNCTRDGDQLPRLQRTSLQGWITSSTFLEVLPMLKNPVSKSLILQEESSTVLQSSREEHSWHPQYLSHIQGAHNIFQQEEGFLKSKCLFQESQAHAAVPSHHGVAGVSTSLPADCMNGDAMETTAASVIMLHKALLLYRKMCFLGWLKEVCEKKGRKFN